MKEAVQSVFRQYATFTGRARRSEYWYFTLFNFIVIGVFNVLIGLVGRKSGLAVFLTTLQGLWSLAVLVPVLALCWRRLHDIGKSGANYLFIFIPLVGSILLIIWFCTDSQPGENQYGPNPKENPIQW
ncbi:MAG: DUF805 domain-containing protein [Oscillospiraceae bacterium]|nr:DUF805 domain-containing protein [Oscillospiraceae bacterium]